MSYKEHRCEQLSNLNKEHNGITIRIRYGYRYNITPYNEIEKWWLENFETDWDWDTEFWNNITNIEFCPFCSEKLELEL